MKKIYKLLTAIALLGFSHGQINAQCISTSAFGSGTANSTGTLVAITCAFGGEYSVITFTAAGNYSFVATGGAGNYITITNTANVVVPGAFGLSPIVVSIPAAGVYHYHVSVNGPPTCATESACHTLNVIGIPSPCAATPPSTAIASSTLICPGLPLTFGTNVSYVGTGITYAWQSSTVSATAGFVAIPSATNPNYATTSNSVTTWYNVVVTCTNGPVSATSTPAQVSSATPTITAIGASVCSPTAVGTLSASSTSTISWYATPTSTTVLGTGNTFTATAATTTTFYAQAGSPTSTAFVGMTSTVSGGAQQTSTNYNIFDVFTPMVINSVEVYPGALGNLVIELLDNVGTLLTSATVSVTSTAGPITIPVNFAVSPGNGYRLAQGAGSVSMFRSSTGVAYPYSIPGVMSMTNSAAGTSFYYFFYNWSVSGASGCPSAKIPVVLTSTTAPTVLVSGGAICAGGSFTLNPTGATSYSYSTGPVVTPTANASYTVTGTTAGCSGNAVASVTVNSNPTVTAISSLSLICSGQTASLTASGASTYSWNTSATTSVVAVSPTVTTSYTVTGTNTNSCSASVVITQSVSACTGLNNNIASTIGTVVYPNPNKGLFTIELNNGSVKTIEVMDLTGRIVLTNTSSNDKIDFNISNLANGVYYVRVQSNNSVEVIKIVKQ